MSKKAQKEIRDAVVLFEHAHYVVPSYDTETGTTKNSKPRSPSFHSIWSIKSKRPDYRPGTVKVYTEQEVAEYVESTSVQD